MANICVSAQAAEKPLNKVTRYFCAFLSGPSRQEVILIKVMTILNFEVDMFRMNYIHRQCK